MLMKTDMYKVYLFWQAVTIWNHYYYKYNFSTYIGKFVTARACARARKCAESGSVSALGGAGPGRAVRLRKGESCRLRSRTDYCPTCTNCACAHAILGRLRNATSCPCEGASVHPPPRPPTGNSTQKPRSWICAELVQGHVTKVNSS